MVKYKGVDIDSKDLYLYNLSDKILSSLKLCYFDSLTMQLVPEEEALKNQPDSTRFITTSMPIIVRPKKRVPEGGKANNGNKDLEKFNAKREDRGLERLNEVEFEKIMDQLSLSGSESSSDDDQDEEQKLALPTIEEYKSSSTNSNGEDADEEESFVSFLNTKSPSILFQSPLLPNNLCFGVYKATLNADSPTVKPYDLLKDLVKGNNDNKISALFMVGGGHFAGAIISHKRIVTKGNSGSEEDLLLQSVQFIEHKTFHRYTTRRKQGGAQSAMDNAKGKANSAGSTLRRYNEQALEEDVKNLLIQWQPLLDQCESIFIKASGHTSQKILLNTVGGADYVNGGAKSSPISSSDPRLKYFPFATNRPTTNEIKRAWCELSYLKVTDLPKEDQEQKLKRQRQREALLKSKQQAAKVVTNIRSESDEHTVQLIQLLKKSKAPALISYIRKNKIDVNFALTPIADHLNTPTMLHYSAVNGLSHMCSVLLTNLKADPTLPNRNGKVAYEVCSNSTTRYSFQVARHNLEKEESKAFDWVSDAKVTESRSKEEVDKLLKEEATAQELEQKRILEEGLKDVKEQISQERVKNYGQGKPLTSPGINVTSEQTNLSSLTDAQRMRVMREQRARAAEERLKKMAAKN